MIVSPHIKDTKHQIENEWTIDEVLDANLAIDLLEELKARADEKSQEKDE